MIHRTFNYCFWLQRYYQRVKECAKLLKVYHKYYLDHSALSKNIQEHPIIIAAGYEKDIRPISPENYASTADLLVWDASYENSIFANLKKARDNAHLIRDIICDEAWVTINDLWLWIHEQQAQEFYQNHRCEFFDVIIEHHQLSQGIFQDTLRHDESYHFMELGAQVEKILIHTTLLCKSLNYNIKNTSRDEPELDRMLLEGVFGWDLFCKAHSQNITPHTLVEFLVADSYFPGSITFCLKELNKSLAFLKFSNKHVLLDIEEVLDDIRKQIRLKSNPKKMVSSLDALTGIVCEMTGRLSAEYFQEKSS